MVVWYVFLLGLIGLLLLMGLLWWTSGRQGNAGVVDIAWTAGIGSLALLYCVFGEGDLTRRYLLAAIVVVWAGRLSWHILHRVRKMPEDGRYVDLKQGWGAQAPQKMFWFFMFQALAAAVFSLPMLLVSTNPAPIGIWDWAAIVLAIVAIMGESLSDAQLQRFREDPANAGTTCREGLWRYSRHPNYFFEWLHWFVYVLLAVGAPFGWLTLLAPAAMLHFILNVTGVPPTERQALKSRPDYREYQRQTSVFFPWPPRAASDSSKVGS